MSLGSTFGSLIGNLASSEIGSRLVQSLGPAVVQQILDQLNSQGYGEKVNSWIGHGPNQPLTVDEVQSALGSEKVRELAQSLGLPAERLSEMLAQHLPTSVDQASKDGTLLGR